MDIYTLLTIWHFSVWESVFYLQSGILLTVWYFTDSLVFYWQSKSLVFYWQSKSLAFYWEVFWSWLPGSQHSRPLILHFHKDPIITLWLSIVHCMRLLVRNHPLCSTFSLLCSLSFCTIFVSLPMRQRKQSAANTHIC